MHFILVCSQLRRERRKANTEPIPQTALGLPEGWQPSLRCCLRSLDCTPQPSWLRDGVGLPKGAASGNSYPWSALGRACLALPRSYQTVRIESARSQAQVCLGPFDEGEQEATMYYVGQGHEWRSAGPRRAPRLDLRGCGNIIHIWHRV